MLFILVLRKVKKRTVLTFPIFRFPVPGSLSPGKKMPAAFSAAPALPALKRGAFATNDGSDRPFRMFPVKFSGHL